MTATAAQRDAYARLALVRWADPVMFAGDVLGMRTWSRQRDMMRAVAEHPRVAVRSGHKVTKSTTAAVIALWWWCTKPRARVILTAPSYRQVDGVIWKEIRRIYREAVLPLGGNLHMKPESGLQAKDGREIIGFSTAEPERMAGFSGPNMLFIVDEASGVDDSIHEAIDGNRAGGSHIFMPSNPTQTSGTFYEAFHAERSSWHCVHISSLDAARQAHLELGPNTGIATEAWCAERLDEWGEDDPRYQVRVLGNFPSQADNAMISLALVEAAAKAWVPAPPDPRAPLQIGADTARFGGDYSAIVWARGKWASEPKMLKGSDNVEVAGEILKLVREHRHPGERVSVRIDTSNNGGVADILRHGEHKDIEVLELQASESPTVEGYSRLRDQLWGGMREWLKDGGAIPRDGGLHSDLTAPTYTFDVRGRVKVESKLDMRKRIGRSTDKADALALAVHVARDSAADVARLVYGNGARGPAARNVY